MYDTPELWKVTTEISPGGFRSVPVPEGIYYRSSGALQYTVPSFTDCSELKSQSHQVENFKSINSLLQKDIVELQKKNRQ